MELIAEELTCARGARVVVKGLSFAVRAPGGVKLTGPNGSGKTTLLRTIAGFLKPAGGGIALKGADAERDIAEQCHYIGHLNGIKSHFTVAENLAFWQAFLGAATEANALEAGEALERFALADLADIPAGYLSAGQKRRLGLARLLVAHRPLWLLDEPTVSLDAASTGLLSEAVDQHIAAGGIVIAATHLPLGMALDQELVLGARQ